MHYSLNHYVIAFILLSKMNIKIKVLLNVYLNELRLL